MFECIVKKSSFYISLCICFSSHRNFIYFSHCLTLQERRQTRTAFSVEFIKEEWHSQTSSQGWEGDIYFTYFTREL